MDNHLNGGTKVGDFCKGLEGLNGIELGLAFTIEDPNCNVPLFCPFRMRDVPLIKLGLMLPFILKLCSSYLGYQSFALTSF
ncbi:hypothetical protein D3C80_1893380 [compost metagenome]